jgi:predicted DNA-binding transcriptional regulator AlpA
MTFLSRNDAKAKHGSIDQTSATIFEALRCGWSRPQTLHHTMEKFIPKAALVESLGVSTRTLENWCSKRDFPSARRLAGSRLVFFCIAEVEAWLEAALDAEGRK